jgi:hypothetical protein
LLGVRIGGRVRAAAPSLLAVPGCGELNRSAVAPI